MNNPDGDFKGDFGKWLRQYTQRELFEPAENLPLRRDMVTLLRYVQENKVVGTPNTGNMPLKAVREVTARFVTPPELDIPIGDEIYRLRSEMDVPPLYFLHILADVGGLLVAEPGRRWRVTPEGIRFIERDPFVQLLYLFGTWWYAVNWLVKYPFEGMGDALPPGFEETTLERMRALPVGERISFEPFADAIIQATGITWGGSPDEARPMLRGAVSQMIIDVLADFGVVECEYRDESFGSFTFPRLDAFKITPLGSILFTALSAGLTE